MFPDDVFSILIPYGFVTIEKPFSNAFSIQDCLSCGKSFRVYQNQSFFDLQTLDCPIEINWIDIGKESEGSSFTGLFVNRMGPQGLKHKLNWKVASPNSDDDKIFKLFSRSASMLSISDGSCESLNSVQNFMDVLENIADEWIFEWMDGRIDWSP